MSKRFLDSDPLTGTETWFHWNGDGTFSIETKQDVTGVVERNKALYNEHDERTPWRGEWHLVGSIPLTVYFDLKQKGVLDDQKALKRWLNDPDNRGFRTRPGQV
jgi:hypothetical protein